MSFDLEKAVREAAPGAALSIPPGTYAVNLVLDKPVSLIGMGTVILDGLKKGPVVRVALRGLVRMAGLLIAGGSTRGAGGGVSVSDGEVELLQCTLRFNEAPVYGGGALYLRGGAVRVSQCRFEGNTGRLGGAILVDETARLSVRDSAFIQNAAVEGGALAVKEAGEAELFGCTLADNKAVGDGAQGGAVSLAGTTSRAPKLSLSHCVLSERAESVPMIFNFERHPGDLKLTRNLLPEWCKALGGDNRFGAASFVGEGSEPYYVKKDSPAVGAGDAKAFAASDKDLQGNTRLVGGRAPDLGAFVS